MSPKTMIIAAAVAAACALPVPPAAAAEDGPAERPMPIGTKVLFNLIDANGDGFVDQTEIAALQRAIFVSIDADGDGKLSAAEFDSVTPGMRGVRHTRFMGHGPRGGRGPDGHWRPRGDRHGAHQPQDFEQHGGAVPRMGDAQGAPDLAAPGNLAVLDINGDGVISLQEFTVGGPGGSGIAR